MKKSLLALAVLGAFAGAASAQTNVTLYGIVDAGITFADDGSDDSDTWALTSGGQSASRFGIRGTEDLGGGLSASFVLEQGFNLDTGNQASTNRQFSRLAYVGLNGGFGGVRLGRQVSPIKAAIDAIDPFGGAGQGGFYDYTYGAFPERIDNAVTYLTPNFGGFTAQAQYAFGEAEGSTVPGRNMGVQVGYGNGPLNVQAAFNKGEPTTAAIAAPGGAEDTESFFVGAAYNFGVAKAHAGFGHTKYELVPGGADLKVRDFLIGATVPFGASALTADWIRTDSRDEDDVQADTINLMYTYALSKRTNFYTVFTHVRNDDASDLATSVEGENANILTVGVRHTF